MLDKNITKLDNNILFMTFIVVVHMAWFDFESWLFLKIVAEFTVSTFGFDVNAVFFTIVEVVFFVTQLLP